MNQIWAWIIQGAINGVFLMLGMILGTKLTAYNIRHEIEDMLDESETLLLIREFLTDQTLTGKATEFFEEVTDLVKSREAKNFFKTTTELLKDMSRQNKRENMPPPPSSSTRKT